MAFTLPGIFHGFQLRTRSRLEGSGHGGRVRVRGGNRSDVGYNGMDVEVSGFVIADLLQPRFGHQCRPAFAVWAKLPVQW